MVSFTPEQRERMRQQHIDAGRGDAEMLREERCRLADALRQVELSEANIERIEAALKKGDTHET